ncbi:MAG: Gfo/Idh/MocA family oxidoreductase [Oscillospiraceae bacterium]|jgi:predicted dehydrogenase|nr:Gfo/Idh/MocA family oxidoreductase [Oscillospiraceae bacterium]
MGRDGRIGVAMIGVGCISGIYLENITNVFQEIELVGVCDLVRERAKAARGKYNIPKLYEDMHEAFADPDVDIVLNLTRPYEHFDVSRAALLAGKHVYCEKPLGATLAEGRALAALAREKERMLGGAPDTFLGAGIQTCRRLIDEGWIGTPIASSAVMITHGPESWHPDPAFYYQRGGGPMLDMGPYYLTALVNLMGGIRRVFSAARASFDTRLITSQPFRGTQVKVEVPTHVAGTIQYESGAVGTLLTTFDVYDKTHSRLDIHGTEGTLHVPDPNTFGGPVRLYRPEEGEARDIPLCFDYAANSRALGLADMANALRDGRPARAGVQQTLHVLEAMEGFITSAREERWVALQTGYQRGPAMLKPRLNGVLD